MWCKTLGVERGHLVKQLLCSENKKTSNEVTKLSRS